MFAHIHSLQMIGWEMPAPHLNDAFDCEHALPNRFIKLFILFCIRPRFSYLLCRNSRPFLNPSFQYSTWISKGIVSANMALSPSSLFSFTHRRRCGSLTSSNRPSPRHQTMERLLNPSSRMPTSPNAPGTYGAPTRCVYGVALADVLTSNSCTATRI